MRAVRGPHLNAHKSLTPRGRKRVSDLPIRSYAAIFVAIVTRWPPTVPRSSRSTRTSLARNVDRGVPLQYQRLYGGRVHPRGPTSCSPQNPIGDTEREHRAQSADNRDDPPFGEPDGPRPPAALLLAAPRRAAARTRLALRALWRRGGAGLRCPASAPTGIRRRGKGVEPAAKKGHHHERDGRHGVVRHGGALRAPRRAPPRPSARPVEAAAHARGAQAAVRALSRSPSPSAGGSSATNSVTSGS
jgi:hypothetical protein